MRGTAAVSGVCEVTYDQLEEVNAAVNALPYQSEATEDWCPAIDGGDCDSYATAKLQRLVAMGWPVEKLRLACCFVEPSANPDKAKRYHAVLLADTPDNGTWVLDNRHPYPVPWDELPYEWHRIYNHDMQAWEYAIGADRSFV